MSLKIKNLCLKISLSDLYEPMSMSRIKQLIIRGIDKNYIPHFVSTQGRKTQPSWNLGIIPLLKNLWPIKLKRLPPKAKMEMLSFM